MRIILVGLIILNSILGYTQTIKGTVSDDNDTVPFVNIIIKKLNASDDIYKYVTTDSNGFYEIKLSNSTDSISIEATAISYNIFQKKIYNLQKNEVLTLDFKLQKRTTSLNEVLIKAKEKPITKVGDTTTYNPDSFKDGSERVIEDLLKKLPGIKVKENGEITFKGKTIKKMLLDGDDLFDSQYTIGSKNISIDMVDKVQAIEQFIENPLLKNLIDSEDVAINIKLKKGKTDLTGTTNLGYGFKDVYQSSATGLLINAKTKGFGLINYNNTGFNPGTYTISSDLVSSENQQEENLLSKKLLKQGSLYSELENKYSNINKNLFCSLKSLFKIKKKITTRVNLGFYTDKLKRTNQSISDYAINNTTFSVNEIEIAERSPTIFNANIKLLDNTSKNYNWEYLGKLRFEEIDYKSNTVNNLLIQNNNVLTKSLFTVNNINFTKQINEKNVLIVTALFSKNSSPQNFKLSPGVTIEENAITQITENNQKSEFDKENLNFNAEYHKKINDYLCSIKIGFSSITDIFNSSLFTKDVNNVSFTSPEFINNLKYKTSFPYSNFNLTLNKTKFSFKIDLGLQFYNLTLEDETRNKSYINNELVFQPVAKVKLKLARGKSISASYSFNKATPNETNLFEGIVQTSYRTFQNNETSLEFLKTHSYNIAFNYSDKLGINRFVIISNYNLQKNNYFTKSSINPNLSYTSSFLLNNDNTNYNFIVLGNNYIHLLKTTLEFDIHYGINLFNDILNNSEVRNITTKNFNTELTMRKRLFKIIYIESKSNYSNIDFLVENEIKNKFSNFSQAFKIAYSSKKNFNANVTANFIASDLSINNNYLFLNSEISFTSKNKKIEYSIIGSNLTNNILFTTYSISDYFKNTFSQNLINRYLLLSVNFKL
ncbi:carboxypeptidase regulatory-like domain-containing protein [Flavobacterium sp.]